MSVVSRNPFDLLGDDGDSSPAPAKTTPAPAKKPEAAAPRAVPGSAPRGGGATRGRGAPRAPRAPREDRAPRADAPEGFETTAGGFDGERVPAPKRAHNGPDKHTKGPANEGRVQTSGGHRARPAGGARGAKTPVGGGERRQFERRSGALPDSQKKIEHGWGANEGTAELSAEVEGEKDAEAEEAAPGTPAEPAAPVEETPEEPEEIQKSYEQFLAERAEAALAFGKKESRQVNSETLEGKAFVREGIDQFFSGKSEEKKSAAKKEKKEKIYIEVDGQFATPPGGVRPPREGAGAERGGRGGRGGARGASRGGDRGGRGRGAPRGAPRPFGGNARQSANVDSNDEKAFPALGA